MFQWDDLRYLLALARTSNSALAAVRLGVNQSTVCRRIATLERDLKTPLFIRTAEGMRLKPEHHPLRLWAEEMETIAASIENAYTRLESKKTGSVKVTTLEEIASLFLIPALPAFQKKWPEIKIDLITSPENLNLNQGDADVALRLGRPSQGDYFIRKVGGFSYGVYAHADYLKALSPDRHAELSLLDWIFLDTSYPDVPEKLWLGEHLPGVNPVLKCGGLKTQMAAVLAGLGAALLPRPMARMHPELVGLPMGAARVTREVWLAVPRDLRETPIVQTVMDFLVEAIHRPPWFPAIHDVSGRPSPPGLHSQS